MIFYYKTSMIIVLPFIICFIFLAFWGFYSLYYIKPFSFFLERFYITSALIFVFFLFSIVNACAQFLDCSEIDGNFYITNYLFESCDSKEYFWWKYFLILPTFISFVIIFPMIILIYMFKNRKNLLQKHILYKVGYMLNGYKRKYFYW